MRFVWEPKCQLRRKLILKILRWFRVFIIAPGQKAWFNRRGVKPLCIDHVLDYMMNELHEKGKTIDEIKEVLKRIPIHPRLFPAIKSAHDLGCELRILSDANLFFIETIVEHLGISEFFSEINTNP